jgi:hypothetical protein
VQRQLGDLACDRLLTAHLGAKAFSPHEDHTVGTPVAATKRGVPSIPRDSTC